MVVSTGANELYELMGYLQSMNSRILSLDKISSGLAHHLSHLKKESSARRSKLKEETDGIRSEICQIRLEIRSVQKSIIQIISVLKASVKSEELERFKRRIDVWAPEAFVTRNEVNKFIEEDY